MARYRDSDALGPVEFAPSPAAVKKEVETFCGAKGSWLASPIDHVVCSELDDVAQFNAVADDIPQQSTYLHGG